MLNYSTSLESSVLFIGIDLAWSPRKPSAGAVIAALGGEGKLVGWQQELGADEEITAFVERWAGHGPTLVSIDAPLVVPNVEGSRPCDRDLSRDFHPFHAGAHSASRRLLGRYGEVRGERLLAHLLELGFTHGPHIEHRVPVRQVIEVYPHPAMVTLFGLERILKYKRGTISERRRELRKLAEYIQGLSRAEPALRIETDFWQNVDELRGRRYKAYEDLLDAIVCAYIGHYCWYWGPERFVAYGDRETGYIVVPMPAVPDRPATGQPAGAMTDRKPNPLPTEAKHTTASSPPEAEPTPQEPPRPRILFLDRDGTINRNLDGRPPNTPAEVEILPGVRERLREYANRGWKLVIVTNQGGVAFGYMSEREALRVHQEVLHQLGVPVALSFVCPHHPRGTVRRYAIECPYRKPNPGAIQEALDRFGARPEDCLFVGDQEIDREAAQAAGVSFRWAWEFFEWRERA